jgi:PKD repeat protein
LRAHSLIFLFAVIGHQHEKLSDYGDYVRRYKKECLFWSETCTLFVLSIMIVLSRSPVSRAMTVGLISAVVAIAIIFFAANVTIINAQQMTNQPSVSQNGTTFFQSTDDSFKLQVPDGWIINDVNNTGSTLSNESMQGYAILAQLCPHEEEQEAALSNVSSRGDTATSCQGSEGEIIHVVRYPDLDIRLQVPNNITTNNGNLTIDNILSYHMQKLQEVGYHNITIVNSANTTVNITNAQTNQTVSIVPAKTVEIQYMTAVSSPNQIREGYFILTATNTTYPNVGMTKGYSVFYEGTSTVAAAVATIQETTAAATPPTPSGSLEPTLFPALVRHMFESFQLIAAPEVIQGMLAAQSQQAQEEPINPLTVEITSSDTEGEAIAPTTFEFEADVGGGTEPYTYSWDFDGEGSSSGEGNEQTVEHTFEEAGSYDVSLTVTDSGGQSASDSMEITIEEEVEEEEPIPIPLAEEEEVEEEVEEEPIPLAEEEEEVEEVEEEEEVQEQRSLSDEIEDEVDALVDDFLTRYGITN